MSHGNPDGLQHRRRGFSLCSRCWKGAVKVDNQIIALYKEFSNCREVAERVGVSDETVRRVLIKHGIPRKTGKKRPEPKYKRPRVILPIDELVRLYTDGKTSKELAEYYGCAPDTILKRLKAAGVEIRNSSYRRVEIDLNTVRFWRELGISLEEIADRLGTTRDVVLKRCMENGIVYGKGHSPSNELANKKNAYKKPLKGREQHFIKRLEENELTKNYEYVGGYKDQYTKVTIRCKTCGYTLERTPHKIFDSRNNHPCPSCAPIERERAKASQKVEEEKQKAEKKAQLLAKVRICGCCGREFHSENDSVVYCSKKCKTRKKNEKRNNGHRARAKYYGVDYDPTITWQTLSEELGHCNCQICGEPCDPNDTSWNGVFGPLYPTVDCIVAMKNGGSYVRGNVQIAHAICNSAKRDLEDKEEILKAVSIHAPNGANNRKRKQARATKNACLGNCRVNRQRGRNPQHGATCETVPRNNPGNCRTRSRNR